MVSRRVLVGLVLLCVAISATAVAGDALESQDGVQEGRRLQSLKKSKPVVVVKKPAKNTNKQKNGDDGLNQNNQNANTGEQDDVDQYNGNEDVKIGGRRLQSSKKSKPVVVVKKPAKNTNKQKNGGDGLNQNNQNANTGEQDDVDQYNGNEDVKIGGRRLQSSKKSKPVVVVKKPAKNSNKQKNGGDGLNQNNQNANTGEQDDVDQYNSNEDVKIGGRRLQSSKKSKPVVVVKKPAKNSNKQKNGGDGLNQNNQNANTGEQDDVDQYNSNEDVKIGGRRLQSSKKSKPVIVVKKPAKNSNKQKNGGDGLNQNNQNANTGEQDDVDQYNGNEDVKIGGRRLQESKKRKPVIVVKKSAKNSNNQSNGGNGINQNNQNANTGSQGDVTQGNSNEGVTIGGRRLQESKKRKPVIVVRKSAKNSNNQSNGGNGINQNNQNANTGSQGDVTQGNSNEGVTIGGRRLQESKRNKPVIVVKKSAKNSNKQSNGGNGINQNNQNANTGSQGDVWQGNSNSGVTIGG